MEYIQNIEPLDLKGTAVALGKFDGFHKGHRLLVDLILQEKCHGHQSVLFTFNPPPDALFSDKAVQVIDTVAERRHKAELLGIDMLIEYPFTWEAARMQPEVFVKNVLIEKIGAKVIAVGEDFCFGHQRRGNTQLLKELSGTLDFKLITAEKIKYQKRDISSTYIKESIGAGRMDDARSMLHGPVSVFSQVVGGFQNGRKMGFPTMNQIPHEAKCLPPNGVYASRVLVGGQIYQGMTNIGIRPTFGEHLGKTVETHIFAFDKDIYGQWVEVQLTHFVRNEKKFGSIDALTMQMSDDMASVKAMLEL